MRVLLIILAALIVAGGSGFYLLQAASPQEAAAEPAELPQQVHVLVPAAPLAAGSILSPHHLSDLPLDPDGLTEAMVVADEAGRTLLLGSVARQPLPKGVPIARSAVVQPGERGFLAAVLPQGKRAISIPISETAGLSGLVMPGDRVDIILTYSVSGNDIDAEREIRASETVLANLRVLALDQRMNQGDATIADQVDLKKTLPIARTATLEVTPQQAEILTLSTQLGELSLVLNSVQDGGEADGETETSADLQAIVAAVNGEKAPAEPRAFTLDAEVTTLLQRAVQRTAPAPSAPSLADRIARVQVVRGKDSRDLEFTPEAVLAGAAAAVTAVAQSEAPAAAAE